MVSRQRSSWHLEKGSWRLEARTTAGILLVLTLLGLLSWVCLIQASKVSTVEYGIWEKEVEIERLQRENAESLAEVLEMLNISQLEDRILELGYVPAEARWYLDVPDYPGGVSQSRLAAAGGSDENAMAAQRESTELEGGGVAQWWKRVLSQFVAWAGTQP
jgi:hypothetical protein